MDEKDQSKKTKEKIYYIILLIALGVGFYISYNKYMEATANNSIQNNNQDRNTNTPVSYEGDYGYKQLLYEKNEDGDIIGELDEDEDGIQDYEVETLRLRSDGTFLLAYADYLTSVGTYSINGNTISLEETVRYGMDACFYTNELEILTATINRDNTISMNFYGTDITFKKGIIEPEDKEDLSRYVINPIDGLTPEGWGDPWIDCSKLKKK